MNITTLTKRPHFKSSIFLISIYGLLVSFNQPYNKEDKIIGNWLLPDNLEIEIFKKGDRFYGKIVEIYGFNDGQEKDINNPDKSKHNDDLIGKIIISGLQYDKESGEWINGTIYAPQKGLTLDLTILKVEGNNIEAKASKLFFRKTITWEKI